MGVRSSGREAALQMLFALEMSGEEVGNVISRYWRALPFVDNEPFEMHPDTKAYADDCVAGVAGRIGEIDGKIQNASLHWRIERMTRIDRNVLRLGAFELVARPDVPPAVIIDEAVELAKRFGTEESGAFVNGVLDRVAQVVGRSAPR